MRTLADCTASDLTSLYSEADKAKYTAHVDYWQAELQPNGALECWFAAEIVRATWRMVWCPLGPESATADAHTIWLRNRERTSAGIRRNLEQLRRLQSDRFLQAHLGIHLPGVASLQSILPGLRLSARTKDVSAEPADSPGNEPPKVTPAAVAHSETILHSTIQAEERRQLEQLAKATHPATTDPAEATPAAVSTRPAAPRNAPCPCKSGQKYKHCCGHWSKAASPHAPRPDAASEGTREGL